MTAQQLKDPPSLFAAGMPVILDIGFGTGQQVVELARTFPEQAILAVDVHVAGIGDLLARVREENLGSIVVVDADVREVLDQLPDEFFSGVRMFYPDPWPKKRHHGRRLVTTAFATRLATFVRNDGWWHIATDWPDYAEQIETEILSSGLWQGGQIDRPDWRPVTRYERHAVAAGRHSTDLWFTRSAQK
jgi:tRNA (guanine-N7-)-methyltransferase